MIEKTGSKPQKGPMMLYASDRMNKLSTDPALAIGLAPDEEERVPHTGGMAAGELAARLKTQCRRGVRVFAYQPKRLTTGVTIDLCVDGPDGSFGILCDAMDMAKVLSRPDCLADSSLDRVYCVSALDSLVDPAEVAESLARSEPGFFRRLNLRSRRRSSPVETVRIEIAGSFQQRTPATHTRSTQAAPAFRAA